MILPFNEQVINDGTINKESFKYPNFIGYLNPLGDPIDFKDKYGYIGHDSTLNIQEYFRIFYNLKIKDYAGISQLEKYRMTKNYLISEKNRNIQLLKQLCANLKEEINNYSKLAPDIVIIDRMELDIYKFLLNCYSANTFFDGVGNIVTCMCEKEFWYKEYKNKRLYDMDHNDFQTEYKIYKDDILANAFKDVMIQYLGYHSIERIPKTITTSSLEIYETFYNYLLNDFTIVQLPKMNYDLNKRKYINQNSNCFFLSDHQLRLKEEIQAIKKYVPLDQRSKYYR